MTNADRWLFKLHELQMQLDYLIMCTPTGTTRNILTDLAIQLSCVEALDNPCAEKQSQGESA